LTYLLNQCTITYDRMVGHFFKSELWRGIFLPREKNKEVEILRAGSMVFCEKGFSNASIQDIADCAEIGKGTIYEYFKSKEDLFISVMEYNHIEYTRKLEEFLGGEYTFKEKLNIFFSYHQDIIEKNIKHIEWMIKNEFGSLSEAAKENIKELMFRSRKKVVKILIEIFNMGEGEGTVHISNKEFIGDIFFEMVIRTCIRFVHNKASKQDKENEKNDLFQFFLQGIQGGYKV